MTTTFKESLTESQTVTFVLDRDPAFGQLATLDLARYEKAIVFCDQALRDTWWPKLAPCLSGKIRLAAVDFLEAAEATKSLDAHVGLVQRLGELRCSRDDVIIAVGGGCVLDAVSYLASVYMRGIPLMMIPTTLIGQADAATAGKTCINTEYAKNVLGTLYLPSLVYNNVTLLHTNSTYHLRQGFSEIFKYGLLGSGELLTLLHAYHATPDDALMLRILEETIAVRLALRRTHPLASNFGHTFGHALEKLSGFSVNHGDAIAVGMVMALEFSAMMGLIPVALKESVLAQMEQLGLNTRIDAAVCPNSLTQLMLTDKKSSNTSIRLVLIRDIAVPLHDQGSPFYAVEPARIAAFLERFLQNPRYVASNHWHNIRRVA